MIDEMDSLDLRTIQSRNDDSFKLNGDFRIVSCSTGFGFGRPVVEISTND